VYVPWFKPEPLAVPLPDLTVPMIGSLPDNMYVHPFGALVAIAVLVGTHIASNRARREGLHPRVFGEMSAYMLIGGFVLGHVLDALFYHWDVVQQNPIFVLQLWNGLSSFGGFIGCILGAVGWLKWRGYPLLPFADVAAYAVPFGWIFGRLGCFVVHDHPGAITDFPLAVANYQVAGDLPPFQVRHDLGLYEVLWCLAVIPLFHFLGRKKRRRGFYAALLPLLYAPVRFGLDFLRATDIQNGDPRLYLGLTPGHFGAVLLLGLGILVALYVSKAGRAELPRETRWTAEDEGVPDERDIHSLLEKLDTLRGPVRVTQADLSTSMVERWPAGVLIVNARGVSDWTPEKWSLLGEEVGGLGPAAVHLWLVEPMDESCTELLREIMTAHPAMEHDYAVLLGGDAAPTAESLEVSVWLEEADEPPWAFVERDDGGIVFGMLSEADAG